MTDLSRPPEEDSQAFQVEPPRDKATCRFAEWFNAAIPEAAPDMRFRCTATGYISKPGGKKEKGVDVKSRCNTCILYQPKRALEGHEGDKKWKV